ncbi:serine/threonine protein kinase [Nocardioides seonyuensis]|uniref:non-specific serine/threonine protein kinase n=1 Tax=Nocardioides seonyuensis TaxID=2518371 RepID=A0A4P7IFF5_9ACTN|nr:serine/threonine-protein kinase [Nocardioides seonyuensis]QBX55313.1 serine/threonine protein kinase [Nocardioides seonyuensis]
MTTLVPGGHADDAGRYVLDSRIATGGMGEVWRARDTVLDRPVAVKVLKTEYADDALFRARFETEARNAASLHHPGIASVFDFGQAAAADGSPTPRPYLVMELVEGQPLSELLRPGSPLDAAVARDLLAQAAEALGAAHRQGIVHRDVKPANLLVTPDRRVKVTDFGIARAAEGMSLTETGQVLGTPAYISPEQAEGSPASAASDVYSLGVVAFEGLAGRKPFVADTPVATAIAHLRSPVPPLPDSVPDDLAAVVRRALSKDPAERYADGAAFAQALREGDTAPTAATAVVPAAAAAADAPATQVFPAAPPAEAAPERRRTTSAGVPWPWVVGLLVLVAALVLALWLASRAGDEPEQEQEQRPTPTETQTGSPTDTPTETPTEPPTEEPEPSETPTETEAAETVEVDPAAYVGRDHKDVEKELRELGLEPVKVELENAGDQGEGIVAEVSPTGTVGVGDTVEVRFWGKAPKEPGNGEGNEG